MSTAELERYRKIVEGLDHANDAIALLDTDGIFIYCNLAWKRLHGLDPAVDYTGISDSVIKRPDLRPLVDDLKDSMLPGSNYETRWKMEVEGEEKTFQICVSYIEEGETSVILVMFRDVTDLDNMRDELKEYRDRLEEIVAARTMELEEANRSLRESEERARTLFQAIPVATYTFRRREDSFILDDYNEAALRMTKGHVAEDIGKKLEELFAEGDRIFGDLERCFSTGETIELQRPYRDRVIGETWELSVKHVFVPPDTIMVHTENATARLHAERELKRHRDNLQELVESRTSELEEANSRLKDEILRREEAQQALVESEQKYRTISEMTSDYTFVASLLPDGNLQREWMAGAFEKITGYTRSELNDKLNEFSVVHPEDRPVLRDLLQGLRSQESVDSIEFRMISKSGENIWVEAYAKPLSPTEEGLARGMIAVKDINKRKTAEVKLARRNRELAVVNRIREIFDAGSEDLDTMDHVLETLLDNSEALAAGVCRVDKEKGELEIVASRNVSDEFLAEYGRNPLQYEMGTRIIDRNRVIILQEEPDTETDRARKMRGYGVFKTIAFPVIVRDRAASIYLIGYGSDSELGPEKARFFDIVRNQIALQLERRKLLADRDRYERKLKDLTGSLIGSLERERNNMALKLHDELGQALVAINGEILFLEKEIQSCENEPGETLAKIKSQLKGLTQNVRQLSYSLHPAVLEDLGIRPALRSYIEKFIESESLDVDLITTGFDGKLTGQAALVMYRIAQEALTNTARHSGADRVTVRLIRGYPDLIMVVEDNGCGFPLDGEEYRGKGLGIISMRERVEGMKGVFKIISTMDVGTRIRVSIPMEEQDDG